MMIYAFEEIHVAYLPQVTYESTLLEPSVINIDFSNTQEQLLPQWLKFKLILGFKDVL